MLHLLIFQFCFNNSRILNDDHVSSLDPHTDQIVAVVSKHPTIAFLSRLNISENTSNSIFWHQVNLMGDVGLDDLHSETNAVTDWNSGLANLGDVDQRTLQLRGKKTVNIFSWRKR